MAGGYTSTIGGERELQEVYESKVVSNFSSSNIYLLVRRLSSKKVLVRSSRKALRRQLQDNPSSETEVGFRPIDPISIIRLGSKPKPKRHLRT